MIAFMSAFLLTLLSPIILLAVIIAKSIKKKRSKIKSIMPLSATDDINNGMLPVINWQQVILDDKEECHYIENAIYEKTINRTRNIRTTNGRSSYGKNGKRYYSSYSSYRPYSTTEYKSYNGMLCITTKKIVFTNNNTSFSIPITSIFSFSPYKNAVVFHCNKGTYKVFVPDGNIVSKLLYNIIYK